MNHQFKNMALLAAVVLCSDRAAFAHAFIDHANPRVGATADQSPKEVRIWFTEAIEPTFSAIEVRAADQSQVDRKDSHADDTDKTELIVSLPPLPAGVYTVSWHVMSADTHKTHGEFKFTVKQAP